MSESFPSNRLNVFNNISSIQCETPNVGQFTIVNEVRRLLAPLVEQLSIKDTKLTIQSGSMLRVADMVEDLSVILSRYIIIKHVRVASASLVTEG